MPYLPYEEPGISTILSLTSLLILLNVVRFILDRSLYCGIIGEILIGIVWGLPVGGITWLTLGMQNTIQALGYLGLIGLVFEGGLNTDLALLKKTAYMSIAVATIGLCFPIALSFILLSFSFSTDAGTAYPSPLAAFSAGASLCSTSLGMTFAILSSAGLIKLKVGTVLIGAAMMDDVVGLIMVNIITTLGSRGAGGWSIARPIVASFGLFLVILALCSYVLRRAWPWATANVQRRLSSGIESPESTVMSAAMKVMAVPHLSFVLSTAVLIVFVTIAYFIHASVLLAAFIAGAVVNFLWNLRGNAQEETSHGSNEMYRQYFKATMDIVLVPFFFASIGFSIPITQTFKGSIVWKGCVYSVLMITGKCLVSLVIYFQHLRKMLSAKLEVFHHQRNLASLPNGSAHPRPALELIESPLHSIALLVGLAMTGRGEIGFLIASLSQSSGTLTLRNQLGAMEASGEELFLVIIWAVVICTIIGPLGVGVIVRRLKSSTNDYAGWI